MKTLSKLELITYYGDCLVELERAKAINQIDCIKEQKEMIELYKKEFRRRKLSMKQIEKML